MVTALEIVVFSLGGAIGYYHLGSEYVTSPAYGSLIKPYVKIVGLFPKIAASICMLTGH